MICKTGNPPKVYIRKAEYAQRVLRPLIFDLLDSLLDGRIKPSSRVLIKPNLIAPASPEAAMTTHPLFVRSVVEYVNEKGLRPVISDSPAMGSFERVIRETGMEETLRGCDVEFKEFKSSRKVDIGPPFNAIDISDEALDADVLINLPKLKTHVQMHMTLGVKNLFGCIVGLRKPEWHYRTGENREMFARLLVRLCMTLNPTVTLLDGILAMEGDGPSRRGLPREIGVVMGSLDPFALDIAVCEMLGIDPLSVFTNNAAKELGLAPERIDLLGELPEVREFRFPRMAPLLFGPPRYHRFMRLHLVQRPVQDDRLCRFCGECWKYCPAGAIERHEKQLKFDYDKCIRCYCCIEVCPYGALKCHHPLAGRIARRFFDRTR